MSVEVNMAQLIKEVIFVCFLHNQYRVKGQWFVLTDAAANMLIKAHNSPDYWIDLDKDGCNCGGHYYGS